MKLIVKKFSSEKYSELLENIMNIFKVKDPDSKVKITKSIRPELIKLGMNWFNMDGSPNANMIKPWNSTVITSTPKELELVLNYYNKFINSGYDCYYENWKDSNYIPDSNKNSKVLKLFPELIDFHKSVAKFRKDNPDLDEDDIPPFYWMEFPKPIVPGTKHQFLLPSDLMKKTYKQYLK